MSIIREEKSYDSVPVTLTITGGTIWNYTESLTITASDDLFNNYDIGKRIKVIINSSRVLEGTITDVDSDTVATLVPIIPIPSEYRGVAFTGWRFATNRVIGLWNFEGQSVTITADGGVVSNPNNDAYELYTVENGIVTLPYYANRVIVGFSYNVDIETLDIDIANQETLINKKKTVTSVSLHLESTKGFWAGPASENEFVGLQNSALSEVKIREDELFSKDTVPVTATIQKIIESRTTSHGRIFIRQSDPLPITVLAISREVKIT
jgi:hypothetical protein